MTSTLSGCSEIGEIEGIVDKKSKGWDLIEFEQLHISVVCWGETEKKERIRIKEEEPVLTLRRQQRILIRASLESFKQ